MPPGADAWTLGGLVIVRSRHADSRHLIAHELEHVRQYHELGFGTFLVRYLVAYVALRLRGYPHQAAYRRIPAEEQADACAQCRQCEDICPQHIEICAWLERVHEQLST